MWLVGFVGEALAVMGEGGTPEQQAASRHVRRILQAMRGERPPDP